MTLTRLLVLMPPFGGAASEPDQGTGPTWFTVDVEDADAGTGWASTDVEDA